ncbi:unnamed protein product [Parascedosporium putredinis]|uniref:Uncharacterized protein n=1 Tax=Parascedosporium putredinis TaxID=1442378 RepID=A0A9P1H2L4_9PEZI|nr:unnamed protein product [Parascedosporium putredinis]CAI7996113.1 unnamed protein product [Parascedosporium putredinis]
MSYNPFRRTGSVPSADTAPNRPFVSTSATHIFDDDAVAPDRSTASAIAAPGPHEPPKTRTKPVKRVRVQTPPPRSPDTEPDTPSFIDRAVEEQLRLQSDPFGSSARELDTNDDDSPEQPGAVPTTPSVGPSTI